MRLCIPKKWQRFMRNSDGVLGFASVTAGIVTSSVVGIALFQGAFILSSGCALSIMGFLAATCAAMTFLEKRADKMEAVIQKEGAVVPAPAPSAPSQVFPAPDLTKDFLAGTKRAVLVRRLHLKKNAEAGVAQMRNMKTVS